MNILRASLFAIVAFSALTFTGCASNRDVEEKDVEIAELNRYIKELESRSVAVAPVPDSGFVNPTTDNQDKNIVGVEKMTDGTGTHFVLSSDVFFRSGSAVINAEARSGLTELVRQINRDYKGMRLVIDGHTDSDPIRHSHWKSNQELSEARAKAVKTYLVERGISSSLIGTTGYASTKSLGGTKAKDRRVDIGIPKK